MLSTSSCRNAYITSIRLARLVAPQAFCASAAWLTAVSTTEASASATDPICAPVDGSRMGWVLPADGTAAPSIQWDTVIVGLLA